MKRISGDSVIRFFLTVIGVVVIAVVLRELKHILLPFTIAYLLFFIFEPLNKVLALKKIPHGVAVLFNLLILGGIFWGTFRIALGSFNQFAEVLPLYETKLNSIVRNFFLSLGIKKPDLVNFSIIDTLQNLDFGGLLSEVFSSTISLFSALLFILLFFVFISTGHSKLIESIKSRYAQVEIKKGVNKFRKKHKSDSEADHQKNEANQLQIIKERRRKKVEKTFEEITEQVQKFISLKFIVTLFMGLMVGFTLYLFNVEFYVVFGVLTVFLNFIPNLGSFIGVSLSSLVVLVQFESVGFTVLVAAILIIEQNIVGNFIEPKIFGNRLGLNPLVILLSLLLWGYIWGIVGMFLAVPLTAIIKIILSGSRSKNMKFLHDMMSA